MTRLTWGDISQRHYEAGVDRGVFYSPSGQGEAWNGLVSVEESPSESGEPRYLDGIRLHNKKSEGAFAATIEAFTYPLGFEDHLGLSGGLSSRKRQPLFNFSYRVMSDTGYKIHLVYNATANPSSKSYQFDDVGTFSWDITTLPRAIRGSAPTAHLIVDAGTAYSQTIAAFEDVLYGSDAADPRMPLPEEVLDIFDANSILKITDNGDGTWTAEGPDDVVSMIDATTFQINWPSVEYIDADTYIVRSW